jgi:uncharacterized protein YjbJ (UPF0337 family)
MDSEPSGHVAANACHDGCSGSQTRGMESKMRSKGRDKAGGTLDKLRGRVKEASGALRGKEGAKAKGQGRQAKGSARKKRGHLRDALRK